MSLLGKFMFSSRFQHFISFAVSRNDRIGNFNPHLIHVPSICQLIDLFHWFYQKYAVFSISLSQCSRLGRQIFTTYSQIAICVMSKEVHTYAKRPHVVWGVRLRVSFFNSMFAVISINHSSSVDYCPVVNEKIENSIKIKSNFGVNVNAIHYFCWIQNALVIRIYNKYK